MRVGGYRITVQLDGFQPLVRTGVVVQLGQLQRSTSRSALAGWRKRSP